MAKKYIITEIEGQKIKLSNLEKVLYPGVGVMKAQLVQYYIQVAKYMLPHISGRPMTLIRYPDGIEANRFYSKNRPSWTPNWVGSVRVEPDDDNIYSLANDVASLAWMANLASLEFHPMTVRTSHLGKPDHFIFDLDPSEFITFEDLKVLAADLKSYLEENNYTPYLKTSGGKGLHIYVPIVPKYEQSEVVAAVKELGMSYVKRNPSTTLRMSKERRKGKILLDIYRNNKSQTCAAPYSTRGKVDCPVSTPLRWDELDDLTGSNQYTILNIMDRLESVGDAWEGYFDNASPLHTDTHAKEDLAVYESKRNFKQTSEPDSKTPEDYKPMSRYVVQIHDASNLHYDLRLEMNGSLRSWAIPKGLPNKDSVKRLAIETEPHPVKYLTFEGVIPKNEYGGGEMWVFDNGDYKIKKLEDKKISFSLSGKLKGDYSMFNTKGSQWLMQRLDKETVMPEIDLSPMLASVGTSIPSANKYFYEIKWDGIRVVVTKEADVISIKSRKGNDLTDKFPLIVKACQEIEAESIIVDGEIVALGENGLPDFSKTVGRMHLQGEKAILSAAKRTKTVIYLFDILYLDGKDVRKDTIEHRREWLRVNYKVTDHLRYSETFEDGQALFDAISEQGMEGIMCKLRGSNYESAQRSKSWLKMKVRSTDTAMVIGYTAGKGDRSGVFGSLHLAKKNPNNWKYKGRVGTGFSHALLKEIMEDLHKAGESDKLISKRVDEESKTTWINPIYEVEIKYASITPNGTYREPVFISLKKVDK